MNLTTDQLRAIAAANPRWRWDPSRGLVLDGAGRPVSAPRLRARLATPHSGRPASWPRREAERPGHVRHSRGHGRRVHLSGAHELHDYGHGPQQQGLAASVVGLARDLYRRHVRRQARAKAGRWAP